MYANKKKRPLRGVAVENRIVKTDGGASFPLEKRRNHGERALTGRRTSNKALADTDCNKPACSIAAHTSGSNWPGKRPSKDSSRCSDRPVQPGPASAA